MRLYLRLEIERFLSAVDQALRLDAVVIPPVRLKGNVLTMVERLFPDRLDDVADRLSSRARQPRRHV